MVQDLLRRLTGEPLDARISLTRKLLAAWPDGNPARPKDWIDLRWNGNGGSSISCCTPRTAATPCPRS